MADIADSLAVELRSPQYSEGYSESFLDSYVATQIKVLREQRGLTQKQLAEALNTSQTVVSRIEGAGYSSWNIKTLKKVARAFDVRLHISFESVGSLIDEVSRFSRKALQRPKRSEDPKLFPAQASTLASIDADRLFESHIALLVETFGTPMEVRRNADLPNQGRAARMHLANSEDVKMLGVANAR